MQDYLQILKYESWNCVSDAETDFVQSKTVFYYSRQFAFSLIVLTLSTTKDLSALCYQGWKYVVTLVVSCALQNEQVHCDRTQRMVRCDVNNLHSEMFALSTLIAVVNLVIANVECVLTVSRLVSSQTCSRVQTSFSFFLSWSVSVVVYTTVYVVDNVVEDVIRTVVVTFIIYCNQISCDDYHSCACLLFV